VGKKVETKEMHVEKQSVILVRSGTCEQIAEIG
jgi:hypothetical protein